MKKILLVLVLAAVTASLSSCRKLIGEGPVVTELRNTANFNAISSGIPGEVVFTESNTYKIEIQAQQNIINVIETVVSGNELRLRIRNNTNIRSHEHIRILVSAPTLNAISVSGSGDFKVPEPFSPDNIRFAVSGSGKIISSMLNTDKIDATISGSGDIQVFNGSANFVDIAVSGSGMVDMLGVRTKTASTHTSGSGTMKLQVSDQLTARISGSGTVYYQGSPTVNSTISGSGRVVKL